MSATDNQPVAVDDSANQPQRSWFSLAIRDQPPWGGLSAIVVGVMLALVAQTVTYAVLFLSFEVESEVLEFALLQATLSSGILPVVAYLKLKRRPVADSLLLRRVQLADFRALAKGIGVYLLVWFCALTVILLLIPEAVEVEQNVGIQAGSSAFTLIIGGIGLVLITPIVEELLFRGFLFRGIAKSTNFWIAALISSVIFGLAHGQLAAAVDTFIFGLIACGLVSRTGTLWPAIIFHVLKNGLAFYARFVEPLL